MGTHDVKKIQKRRRDDDDDDDHDHDEDEDRCDDDGSPTNSCHEDEDEVEDEEARAKNRVVSKAQKKFSIALIQQAVDCEWEEHDIARLVLLITKERSLDSQKTLKLLQRCQVCTPIVLTNLMEDDFEFSSSQLIGALYDQAGHVDKFIQVIEDSLEQRLLNIMDEGTIQALFDTAESSMNPQQFRRFARGICDHSNTKRYCGRVLNVFACRMSSSEASSFVCDIVSYDFFLDLSGSMKSFYKEMPEIGNDVQSFLASTRAMNPEGELIDSDEDEDGNLRDFIENDDGEKKGEWKKPRVIRNQYPGDADSDTESSYSSDETEDSQADGGVEDGKYSSRVKNHLKEVRKREECRSESEAELEDSDGSDGDDDGDGASNADADYEIDIASGSDSGQDNDDLDEDKTAIETMDSPRSNCGSNSDIEYDNKHHSNDVPEVDTKKRDPLTGALIKKQKRNRTAESEKNDTATGSKSTKSFVDNQSESQRKRRVIADDDDE